MSSAVLTSRALAAGLAAGIASLACSDLSSTSSEPTGRESAAILNGTPSGREDDAVVMVVSAATGVTYRCTGTLIAHNLVMTARHCVSDFDELPFTCLSNGELDPSSRGGRMRALYMPSQVSVRIGDGPKPVFGAQAAQLFGAETSSICRNDIALILLDRELSDLPIMPIRLTKGTNPGEEVRLVGYGADENGNTGNRKTLSGQVITQVGASEFRSPGDPVPPRTFVTLGPALCIGDSGGPAFTNDTVLTGVWSQVVGDCTASTARNYFTEVAPFASGLILPAFEAAGADPWVEGATGPGPITTGGSTSTGGSAGETSTGGDAGETGETGGMVGTGGAGSFGGGGTTGSGGDEPGSGGTETNGGSDATGGMTGNGLRKKGGCTCGVVGAPSGQAEWALAPLAALMLLRRRRGCARVA
jgi:hypothetical protein